MRSSKRCSWRPQSASSLIAALVVMFPPAARALEAGVGSAPEARGASALTGADSTPASPKRIDLKAALRLGASRAPEVAAAAAPRGAIAETRRASSAILTSQPRATVSVGERRGPLGSGVEVTATVMQDVPLADVRGARRETAAALGQQADADLARARLEGAARAALAWIDLAEAERVLALRREGLEQASGILRVISRRAASGVADPLELALARGEEAAARVALIDAEGLRFEAAAALRFAIGEAPGAAIEAGALDAGMAAPAARASHAEGEPTAPSPEEEATVRRALRDHPLVKLAEARAHAAQNEVRLEAAQQAPTVGLGASFTREGTSDVVWSGVVSVPLPLSRPWAFDVARRRAAADSAGASLSLVRAELAREIRAAFHDRDHTQELYEALAKGALGPAREGLRLARAQLDAGTLDVSKALLARQRLLATEEQVARALAGVRRAEIRLLRVSGALPGGGEP